MNLAYFADEIRQARKRKGITQRALADIVGVDFSYISKIETAKTGIPISKSLCIRLADALDLDRDMLLMLINHVDSQAIARAVEGSIAGRWLIRQIEGGALKHSDYMRIRALLEEANNAD